jgi:hypothetical protein
MLSRDTYCAGSGRPGGASVELPSARLMLVTFWGAGHELGSLYAAVTNRTVSDSDLTHLGPSGDR